ncbi:MAG: hypothetical protein ABI389_06815 [Rhodanobacter sp.]
MIARFWVGWLARFGARDVAGKAPPPFPRDWSDAHVAAQHVEVGDVPVFDQRHRQVGFIPCRADIVDDVDLTAARWMSHCMNDPVSWWQQAIDADEVSRLVGTANLHRVPLVNNNNQVCGVVVLDATARPASERVALSFARGGESALNTGR